MINSEPTWAQTQETTWAQFDSGKTCRLGKLFKDYYSLSVSPALELIDFAADINPMMKVYATRKVDY